MAVVADGGGDRAALHAEAPHERDRDIVVDAVARDDRDLDEVLIEIDPAQTLREGQGDGDAFGDDLAGHDADRLRRGALAARVEILGRDAPRLDAVAPDRRDRPARGE